MDREIYLPDGYTTIRKIGERDGYEVYDLFFGPNHPGMHGNFGYVLDMMGTEIVRVRPNAGMLHRGFEKAMERKKWVQNLALIPRVCVVDPDPNEVAYCQAVEELLGAEVPVRARYLRTITLEMSRLTSFLMGMGGVGGAIGLYSAMYLMMADRDRLLDMFEALTGARVYHIFNVPGGVRRDAPDGWFDGVLQVLDELERNIPEWDRLVFENPVVCSRLEGLAPITQEEARRTGLVGPNLRSTGAKFDVRVDAPYAAYDELDVEIQNAGDGKSDALLRAVQVRLEYEATIRLLRQAIAKAQKLPAGPVRADVGPLHKLRVPRGDAYSKVESSKGEFGYYIVSNGGYTPYRVSVRGPSMPAGIHMAKTQLPGMKIDDVAVWMATLAICAPDIDR